ncbi:MAG: hypothetical protein FWB91_13920 [Defluviitaleaceae bacterium]|nr:hypothetical protein [Defluviitaleaceae bacterium]
MFWVFGIAFFIIALLMVVLVIRTIIIAFFTRKDERMKLVVIKSMAHAFCVLLALQVIQALLKFVFIREAYDIWWSNFTARLYVEPAMLSMIILGIALIINQRRFS